MSKAIIAKIDVIHPIAGADRIQVAMVLGESVVVSKDLQVGHVGVLFIDGTQLSEQYCHENNLFRDKEMNKDKEKSGFFERTRRVRAQPFLKVKSTAYFADLESLSYTGYDVSLLKVGDTFDVLNDVQICTKYISEKTKMKIANNQQKAKKKKSVPYFAEHVDTSHFSHNVHRINKGDLITIQSKRHGTSFRVGHAKSVVELPKWKQIVNSIFPVFNSEQYEIVVGTRRVVLKTPEKEGFHGSEAYRFDVANEITPYLSKGMTVYGEIVGYVNGGTIMPPHNISALKNKEYTKKYGDKIVYKYGCVEGQYKFHIYRITVTSDDGTCIDFSQKQLVQWCKDRGFDPAYDVVEPFIYDGDQDKLIALVNELTERPDVLTECYHDASHISEGVIVRVENGQTTPLFLKSKSYAFRVLEGHISEDVVDTEDAS